MQHTPQFWTCDLYVAGAKWSTSTDPGEGSSHAAWKHGQYFFFVGLVFLKASKEAIQVVGHHSVAVTGLWSGSGIHHRLLVLFCLGFFIVLLPRSVLCKHAGLTVRTQMSGMSILCILQYTAISSGLSVYYNVRFLFSGKTHRGVIFWKVPLTNIYIYLHFFSCAAVPLLYKCNILFKCQTIKT